MIGQRIRELGYYFFIKLPSILMGKFKGNLIYAHWGRGLNNFGDCLAPDILRHFGLNPVYCQQMKADIILAGTLLQWIPESYSGIILGTGVGGNMPLKFPNARILGVRGKLTRDNLVLAHKERLLLGDTGLIMSYVYPQAVMLQYKLGVIPHFVDLDHAHITIWKKRFGDDVTFISPLGSPEKIIKQIKSCSAIVASSLHGLVIADSFNIPNIRFVIRDTMPAGGLGFDYKYRDYYSGLNINPDCIEIDGSESLDFLLSRVSIKTSEATPLKEAIYLTLKETCETFRIKQNQHITDISRPGSQLIAKKILFM